MKKETFDFSEALRRMKEGKKVLRKREIAYEKTNSLRRTRY